MKRFISLPVLLADTEQAEMYRINMVAYVCQPLFARTSESFVMHLNLSTTKRPDRSNEHVTLGGDLVMREVVHSDIHTKKKTMKPMLPPKSAPASRPQRIAFVICL
jgi:hypothetical protein